MTSYLLWPDQRNEVALTKVWAIIVGYRNALEIETCLRALAQQSYPSWGVVVCENGGSDAFARLTATLCAEPVGAKPAGAKPAGAETANERKDNPSRVRATHVFEIFNHHALHLLQAEENLGYAGAINAAVSSIRSDLEWTYIWILNPDTEPRADALAYLLAKADKSEYGIVGGRLIYKETRLVQAYGGIWTRLTARGISIGRDNSFDCSVDFTRVEKQMDYVLGACMLVTRPYINVVGLMRDDYFLYCEEVDWCLRRGAFKLGYAHDAIIYHTQGTTLGSKGRASERSKLAVFLDERNRLLISRRFYPRRFPIIAIIAALRICRYARHAAWQNFWVALRGWWAGVRNEVGVPPDNRI